MEATNTACPPWFLFGWRLPATKQLRPARQCLAGWPPRVRQAASLMSFAVEACWIVAAQHVEGWQKLPGDPKYFQVCYCSLLLLQPLSVGESAVAESKSSNARFHLPFGGPDRRCCGLGSHAKSQDQIPFFKLSRQQHSGRDPSTSSNPICKHQQSV